MHVVEIACSKNLSEQKHEINFKKFMNASVRKDFNKKLKKPLDNCVD